MRNASFSDWLSRLRLTGRGTHHGDTSSRSHFLALTLLNFSPGISRLVHPESFNTFFRNIIGPFPCVEARLERSAPSLFTENREISRTPKWVCSPPSPQTTHLSDDFEFVSNALNARIPSFISSQLFSSVCDGLQTRNHKIFRVEGDVVSGFSLFEAEGENGDLDDVIETYLGMDPDWKFTYSISWTPAGPSRSSHSDITGTVRATYPVVTITSPNLMKSIAESFQEGDILEDRILRS